MLRLTFDFGSVRRAGVTREHGGRGVPADVRDVRATGREQLPLSHGGRPFAAGMMALRGCFCVFFFLGDFGRLGLVHSFGSSYQAGTRFFFL